MWSLLSGQGPASPIILRLLSSSWSICPQGTNSSGSAWGPSISCLIIIRWIEVRLCTSPGQSPAGPWIPSSLFSYLFRAIEGLPCERRIPRFLSQLVFSKVWPMGDEGRNWKDGGREKESISPFPCASHSASQTPTPQESQGIQQCPLIYRGYVPRPPVGAWNWDSAKPYIYYAFSYTYVLVIQFNL